MGEEKPVMNSVPTKKAVVHEKPLVAPPSQAPVPTNGLAVAAMIVGIVAFFSGWVPFWGLLTGAAAVVLGILALKKLGGKGMAIAGISTGGIAALTSLLFTILLIITITSNGALIGEAANQALKQSTQDKQMIDAKKDFAKGETAVFGDFQVKVNSVQYNYVPDDNYYQPDDGNQYIVVNATIKNTGTENGYIDPYSFKVNDGNQAFDSTSITVSPELSSDSLLPGGTITGNIVYEIPKDASNLKLQYETTVYDTNYQEKQLIYTLAI